MSTGKKPLVIVTRKLPDPIETRMRELFDTRLNEDDQEMSPAELVEAVKHADVLVPTVTDRINSRRAKSSSSLPITAPGSTISTCTPPASAASWCRTRQVC